MKSYIPHLLLSLLATTALARPVDDVTALPLDPLATGLPRLAIYYQTTHNSAGQPISMLPLITEKQIALTHLIVCSLHVNVNGVVHLNDFPPSHPRFSTLWEEAAVLRNSGIRVIGMVGGAAAGSFSRSTLDAPDGPVFEHYYGQLRDVIGNFSLQGMDIDVEQAMSQAGIARLVRRLVADFGQDFTVTLAPVATALNARGSPNLSGFSYRQLEDAEGGSIEFYNAQFYNGFGSMADTAAFDSVVSAGWDPRKVVVGQITTPDNGGQFVPFDQLAKTLGQLRVKYGEIGGVMGWEYFNGRPGGTAQPWEWAQQITAILRPDLPPSLKVTSADAERLDRAWAASVAGLGGDAFSGSGSAAVEDVKPKVDYWAMVNS